MKRGKSRRLFEKLCQKTEAEAEEDEEAVTGAEDPQAAAAAAEALQEVVIVPEARQKTAIVVTEATQGIEAGAAVEALMTLKMKNGNKQERTQFWLDVARPFTLQLGEARSKQSTTKPTR
jgi:hypothetical protein